MPGFTHPCRCYTACRTGAFMDDFTHRPRGGSDPAWSPDGRYIALTAMEISTSCGRMEAATAGPRRREPGLRWEGPLGLALVAATSPLTPAGFRRPAGDAPCKRRGGLVERPAPPNRRPLRTRPAVPARRATRAARPSRRASVGNGPPLLQWTRRESLAPLPAGSRHLTSSWYMATAPLVLRAPLLLPRKAHAVPVI
jgi:hypothetical protein